MASRSAIEPNVRIWLSPSAVSTTVPDEAVILDPNSGRYFGLEGVGARVWSLLEKATTMEALIGTIVAEYDVDEETCERDLRVLLADLHDSGLIVVEGSGA